MSLRIRQSLRLIALMLIGSFSIGTAIAEEENVPRTAPTEAEKQKFFEDDVLPILKTKCFRCHGGEAEIQGGLNLTVREKIFSGGESGFTLDPDALGDSLLIDAINYRDLEMPPTGKMSPQQIATLERWVEMGLPWRGDGGSVLDEAAHAGPPEVNEKNRSHWAFQPVRRPELPEVQNEEWIRQPLDRFVLTRLEKAGLSPAPAAPKTEWLRRATYDLTGLPPTAEEVRDFLADDSESAYERVIDRLLDSPRYGEHWARYWLDLVRYGETNSFERDNPKPFVWRYRDYVIRSLNEDKPYDRFIREQLAGDELPDANAETIIATGYYRLGIWDDEPADRKLAMYDELDDIVSTTGQAFLGLTINCARCHDHKLDPIPQADYYRFVAFFRGIRPYGVRSNQSVEENSLLPIATPEEQRLHAERTAAHQKKLAETKTAMGELEKLVQPDLIPVEREEFRHEGRRVDLMEKRVPRLVSPEQFERYKQLVARKRELLRNPPGAMKRALAIKERGAVPPPTPILMRGNPHAEGDIVEPDFPQILAETSAVLPSPDPNSKTSGRRSVLANWIASPENPLTSRVMVNRIWQNHFGRGLVRSPNNFGLQGIAPTHPALLDYLATEFVGNGWKLKPLHRSIMLSATYRMGSRGGSEVAAETDPSNDLFWRFDPRRLRAEEIRDSILAVNSSLNVDEMFGPSVYPIIPKAVLAGQSRPGAGWNVSRDERQRNRRTVYVHVKRSLILPIMSNFDGPETDLTCPTRFSTTQPTQALNLLNSEFIHREAARFAQELRSHSDQPTEQIREGLRRVLQREPTEQEVDRAVAFWTDLGDRHGITEERRLKFVCVLLYNLNEFVYLD